MDSDSQPKEAISLTNSVPNGSDVVRVDTNQKLIAVSFKVGFFNSYFSKDGFIVQSFREAFSTISVVLLSSY